jgi:iturin family lipopeptide synthetase A
MVIYETLVDAIKSAGKSENKGIIFINSDSNETFTSYNELYENSFNVLYNLQLMGIKSGQELLFLVEDNEKFIKIFWACIIGGIIPVPVPIGNTDEDKEKIINIWKKLKNPSLITDSKTLSILQEHFTKRSDIISDIENKTIFLEKIEEKQGMAIVDDISRDNAAYIQFSSGSTGNPKGVVLTHENLLVNINAIINSANVNATDSWLSWVPLTHNMGLIAFHMVPIVANINQYVMPNVLFIKQPFLWLKKASEHKVATLGSPNFGYKHFLDHFKPEMVENLELSHIRAVFNGAEPINSELCDVFLDKMSQYGLKRTTMSPAYGLAEASEIVTMSSVEKPMKTVYLDRNSILTGQIVTETNDKEKMVPFVDVGSAVNDCDLRIWDNAGRTLNDNIIGHIQVKGRNVTRGYYQDIDETKNIFTEDGWLRTGDLGFMRDGNLIVTGRAKDIIFVNGQNYYPQDIENVAMDIGQLELGNIVAYGVFNMETQREDILLFVKSNSNLESFAPLATLLKDKVSRKIGYPIKLVVPVKDIPKTVSGKVQRNNLAEQYTNGEFYETLEKLKELTVITYVAPSNEVEEKLTLLWQDILEIERVGTKDNFFDLGGHSLTATTLIYRIHEQFNVKVPLRKIFEAPTIIEIAEYIKNAPEDIYSSIKPVEEQE